MKCPLCGSEKVEKIGYDIFNDSYECDQCEEEFEVPRDKATDPADWVYPWTQK